MICWFVHERNLNEEIEYKNLNTSSTFSSKMFSYVKCTLLFTCMCMFVFFKYSWCCISKYDLSTSFKKVQKFQEVFLLFSLYFQRFLDSVLIFNVAANLVCLNVVWKATKITGYNITRKTAPKYFQQYSKSNFLTTTRWPLCHCTKKYNTNYRHLLQNNIAQRNQRWSFHPFSFWKTHKNSFKKYCELATQK